MIKGKYGFLLWLYPFIAMWTVLVGPSLASVLILGFVIAAEKDDWTIRQCIHVVMFNVYWNVYKTAIGFLSSIPLLGMVISIIDVIVFIVMLILILILGLGRLKNGQDIGLPGKGIVNRAYGLMQSVPMYRQYQQAPPQYQQQNHQTQQPPIYTQPPQQPEYQPQAQSNPEAPIETPPPAPEPTIVPPPAQSELKQPPPPPEF